MTCTTAVYDLSQILHYPIRVEVNTWDSRHPLRWVSYNDEGQIASGQFLEPPGLPLFTLEDDAGRRLCDALPESVSAVAALMPAMDFELAQACATSEAARELANDAPLLFILAVDHARKQSWSLEAFNAFLAGKRSDILKAVGLPGSRSLVRLVRRLALSPLLPWELEDIRAALQNPEYLGLMRHHPHLHVNHLRLLNRVRHPLWPGLLNLVDEHTSAVELSWLCRMIRDSLAMAGGNEQVRWTPSVGQPDGAPCPVITMDLDRFKMVNDTFGHEAGDTVLVEVYKCVRAELRQIDMMSRWAERSLSFCCPIAN
ncbi:hypothetical protein ASQ50_18530 [Marinobacter sp. LQ44]|nr:diguanylate cyclase [Marinobacter sp. LQ44]AMQ90517.1 hypothetical protein ASQ50_18530 [Marinobacter sp. LQ44]